MIGESVDEEYGYKNRAQVSTLYMWALEVRECQSQADTKSGKR